MKRLFYMLMIIGIFCSLVSYNSQARQVEIWTYNRLFKEAELVVIARPVESKDVKDRFKPKLWNVEFEGVNTTFKVHQVLKGELDMDKLVVLHYKTDKLINNGPCLVSFRLKKMSFTLDNGIKYTKPIPNYLLFLKQTKDIRYELVSGQVDPEFSVFEVTPPYPAMNDEDAEKRSRIPNILNDRTNCILAFKDVLTHLKYGDLEEAMKKVADGNGAGTSFRIKSSLDDNLKDEAKKKKFIEHNFKKHEIIYNNFDKIMFSRLQADVDIKVKTDFTEVMKDEGKLFFISAVFPEEIGVNDNDKFTLLRFIKLNNKFYWVPFGW